MKFIILVAILAFLQSCGPAPSYEAYKPAPPPAPGSPEAPKPHVGLVF